MNVDARARDAAFDALAAIDEMQRAPAGLRARAGTIDGFRAFETRRRRAQRTTAVVAAIVIAALGLAGVIRAFRSAPVPSDRITPDNVQRLEVAWTGALPPDSAFIDSVAGEGYVVAYGLHGNIAAFRSDCGSGGAPCEALWTANVVTSDGDGPPIIASVPVIAGGYVLVAGERCWDGGNECANDLYSFPLACRTDGQACSPRWVAPYAGGVVMLGFGSVTTDGRFVYASGNRLDVYRFDCGEGGATCEPEWSDPQGDQSPAVWQDTVIVAQDGGGRIAAFDVDCGSGGGECAPTWRSALRTGSEPVIVNGVVYAAGSGVLAAYPVDCGTDNALCEPLWSVTRPEGESFSRPIVSDGVLYTSVTSFIPSPGPDAMECSPTGTCRRAGTDVWTYHAYSVECIASSGSCDPLWTAGFQEGELVPRTAVAGSGRLYVVAVTDQGTPDESTRLLAFDGGCRADGAECHPDWVVEDVVAPHGEGFDLPVVAEGLVFAFVGREVRAYASDCGTGAKTCEPIWSAPVGTGAHGLRIDGETLLVGSKDGEITVFALDGEVTSGEEEGSP
jgi:hypothetical protein